MSPNQTCSSGLDDQLASTCSTRIRACKQVGVPTAGPSSVSTQVPVDLPHEHHTPRLIADRPGRRLLPARPTTDFASHDVHEPLIGVFIEIVLRRRSSSRDSGTELLLNVFKPLNFLDGRQADSAGRQARSSDFASPVRFALRSTGEDPNIMSIVAPAPGHPSVTGALIAVVERQHSGVWKKLGGVSKEDLHHEGHAMAVWTFRSGQSLWPPGNAADLGNDGLARIPWRQDHSLRLQRLPPEFCLPLGLFHLMKILPRRLEMKTGFTQRRRVNPDEFLVAGGGFEPPTSGL
jgi:hypothetical protein